MEIYPAVDIKDGKCVNLLRGDFNESTVFDESPVDAALRWAAAGAGWIHVVDLDGARAGHPLNLTILAEIASATGCQIQAGGGLRRIDDVRSVFAAGAARAVLGTAAIEDFSFVEAAASRFPNGIAVGLDTREGRVATRAWTATTDVAAVEVAEKAAAAGVSAIIHTDIERDGMMGGPGIQEAVDIAAVVDVPVIVSGGVSTIDDVCDAARAGIDGVIIGRALYTGDIDLREALKTVREILL